MHIITNIIKIKSICSISEEAIWRILGEICWDQIQKDICNEWEIKPIVNLIENT